MENSIGLYIRVSTEEQASSPEGSIKNQEERLKSQVKVSNLGKVFEIYTDRAKSGKDTKRPALQKMLRDISDKKINLVMVSEISRLSRSVKDFTHIWELLNQVGCKFLSLREKFDPTTAAGEMLLMNIASFSGHIPTTKTIRKLCAMIGRSRSERIMRLSILRWED